MQKEREADVTAVRRMVEQAAEFAEARPSFVSDEGVYDGLRQWQAMMAETRQVSCWHAFKMCACFGAFIVTRIPKTSQNEVC